MNANVRLIARCVRQRQQLSYLPAGLGMLENLPGGAGESYWDSLLTIWPPQP